MMFANEMLHYHFICFGLIFTRLNFAGIPINKLRVIKVILILFRVEFFLQRVPHITYRNDSFRA